MVYQAILFPTIILHDIYFVSEHKQDQRKRGKS